MFHIHVRPVRLRSGLCAGEGWIHFGENLHSGGVAGARGTSNRKPQKRKDRSATPMAA